MHFRRNKSQSQNSVQNVWIFFVTLFFGPKMFEFIFMNLAGHNFLYKEKGDPEIFHGGGTILLVPIFWSATLSHIWGGGAAAIQSWTTKKVCTDFFNGPSKLPNLASVSLIGVVTTRRLSSTTTMLHPVQHKNKWLFMTMTFFTLPTYWFCCSLGQKAMPRHWLPPYKTGLFFFASPS